MIPTKTLLRGAVLAAPAFLALILSLIPARGEEPGRLGRFFRFGGAPPSASNAGPLPPSDPPGVAPRTAAPLTSIAPEPSAPAAPARLIPQPRNYRGITSADPLVTRTSIGRSAEGNQFGMFLQVFADGTVIDGEGVHSLGREGIKPVLDALKADELYRVKGHCGGPPTDYMEHVHVVVFERSLGRLRANAFSFSGNQQGCDHAVRHLQTVLDGLQEKFSRPAPAPVSGPSPVPSTTRTPAPILLNAPERN